MRELHLLKPLLLLRNPEGYSQSSGDPEPDVLSLQKYILLLTLTFP